MDNIERLPEEKDRATMEDVEYFTNKLLDAVKIKDWKNVIRAARQLELFEDAVVIYRIPHHREECDNE